MSGGTKENQENLGQDSRSTGRDLKPGHPEYEVAVTKVEESKKGLETNGTHQIGVYANVSSLVEIINIITKNKDHQMLVEKSKCRDKRMFMSRHQTTRFITRKVTEN
jgi:hypothetical protein